METDVGLSEERLESFIGIAQLRYLPIIKNLLKKSGYVSDVFRENSLEDKLIKSIAYGELFLNEYNVCLKDKKDGYHGKVIASYIVSKSINEHLKEEGEEKNENKSLDLIEYEFEYDKPSKKYYFLRNIEIDSKNENKEEGMDFLLNDFVAFQRSENPNSYNEFYLKTKEYFSLLDKICADKIQKFDDNYITIARNAIDNIGIEELSLGIFNTLKEFQNDSFENVFGNKKTIDSVKKICNSLLHYFPSVQKNPYPVPSAIIFSGEPGTGKTMVARAMVNYLSNHAKLFKKNFTARFIDQTIKDRYYGESEKILKEAFEAVKNHNGIGILVVDEADTIFPPINYSNGILETSLMGLLLNELDGIKRSQRNNFTSVFITNRPYNGIMDALHSRAKEFVFEKYQDNIGYKMQIENYLLGLGFASSERFDLNEISNTCLDFSLSGRDVKNILDTLFYEKSVVGLKNLFQKRNFSEIKFEAIKEFSKIENKDFIEGIKSFYIEKEKLKNNELSEKIRSISEAIICQEMGKDLALEKLNYKNEK